MQSRPIVKQHQGLSLHYITAKHLDNDISRLTQVRGNGIALYIGKMSRLHLISLWLHYIYHLITFEAIPALH